MFPTEMFKCILLFSEIPTRVLCLINKDILHDNNFWSEKVKQDTISFPDVEKLNKYVTINLSGDILRRKLVSPLVHSREVHCAINSLVNSKKVWKERMTNIIHIMLDRVKDSKNRNLDLFFTIWNTIAAWDESYYQWDNPGVSPSIVFERTYDKFMLTHENMGITLNSIERVNSNSSTIDKIEKYIKSGNKKNVEKYLPTPEPGRKWMNVSDSTPLSMYPDIRKRVFYFLEDGELCDALSESYEKTSILLPFIPKWIRKNILSDTKDERIKELLIPTLI